MEVVLKLNARLQPMHRHELEDAIQGVLEKEQMGEVTGGGTVQNPDGEIVSCDIDIHLAGDKWDHVSFLVNLLNRLGIPNSSALLGIDRKFRVEVGTLEGLAYYLNNTDLPDVVYETCDINHVVEQMELAMKGIGGLYSYWESDAYTALYFYGNSYSEMKQKIEPFVATYPLCQESRIEQIA